MFVMLDVGATSTLSFQHTLSKDAKLANENNRCGKSPKRRECLRVQQQAVDVSGISGRVTGLGLGLRGR